MSTIHELAAQADWEMEGTRRGILRYQEAAAEADPMTLAPGRALILGVVGPLITAIELKQLEAVEQVGKRGLVAPWAWPVQLLDPRKAAVITLNVAVRAVCGGAGAERSGGGGAVGVVTQAAFRLSEALRDQLQYDRWRVEAAQTDAEAARSKVEAYRSQLEALKWTYPNVDRRVWARWAAKLEMSRNGDNWDTPETGNRVRIAVGTMLLDALVAVAPDRFEIAELPRAGGAGFQAVLKVTEKTLEVLNDVRERAEVARPLLMPMICKPLPWRYADAA